MFVAVRDWPGKRRQSETPGQVIGVRDCPVKRLKSSSPVCDAVGKSKSEIKNRLSSGKTAFFDRSESEKPRLDRSQSGKAPLDLSKKRRTDSAFLSKYGKQLSSGSGKPLSAQRVMRVSSTKPSAQRFLSESDKPGLPRKSFPAQRCSSEPRARERSTSSAHNGKGIDPVRERVNAARQEFERLRLRFATSCRKRPHLAALTQMRIRNRGCFITRQGIGSIPGVQVGDMFYYRAELCLLGLHKHLQAGIGYERDGLTGVSIATSIVFSGGYADDRDGGDTFVYTGSGGNNAHRYKHPRGPTHQKLEKGNLALVNSKGQKNPIRVIRGIADEGSPSKTVYIYDGLYEVVDYINERGKNGCKVFKFIMKRRPGQPPRTPHFVRCIPLK